MNKIIRQVERFFFSPANFFTLLLLILFIFFTACVSVQTTEAYSSVQLLKTEVTFENNTIYSVDILEDAPYESHKVCTIPPYSATTHAFDYSSESNFYFYAQYEIPFFDTKIAYLSLSPHKIETKNGLQHKITIGMTENELFKTSYFAIENKSANEIFIRTNASKEKYQTIKNTNTIESGQTGIFSSADKEFIQSDIISMCIENNGKIIQFPNMTLRKAFAYTFLFDGTSVTLEDARPLVKIGEPSWSVSLESKSFARKIIASKNADSFFYINNFIDEDENGAAFRMASITAVDSNGKTEWTAPVSVKNGDCEIYDICLADENLFVIGQSVTGRNGGKAFSALYSPQGKQLDFKEHEAECFSAISKITEQDFLISTFDTCDGIVTAKINGNKISYGQIPLEKEKIDFCLVQVIPFYDDSENAAYLFCNRQSENGATLPSVLYRLSPNGETSEISLQNQIQSISSVCKNGESIFIGGESVSQTNSAATVLKLNPATKEIQTVYQDKNPFSYISAIKFNAKTDELVVSGTLNAKNRYGKGGTPFILALNRNDGSEIWKTLYTDEKSDVLLDFTPCDDYGFVELFCDVTDDSVISKKILRTNATGKYK